jgi:hypothetical protein
VVWMHWANIPSAVKLKAIVEKTLCMFLLDKDLAVMLMLF